MRRPPPLIGREYGSAMPARPKRPKPRAIKRPDPALRARARKILARLAKANPDWGPTLRFSSPLELLVATILAAPAQAESINEVTRVLFTKYRSPADYAAAPAGGPRAGHQGDRLLQPESEVAPRDGPWPPGGVR